MTKYFIRLDDACPVQNHARWNKVLKILSDNNIKPMIGIIPANQDPQTTIDSPDSDFWDRMRNLQSEGAVIALHGYNHCYATDQGGINPIHARSEFAGLPLDQQKTKIAEGYKIFCDHGLTPTVFFAPSHTFDLNTLQAITEMTPIRVISDTFSTLPYRFGQFLFLPQQMGKFRHVQIPGVWTFCFHPNEMTDNDIEVFEQFIKAQHDKFGDYNDILNQTWGKKRIADRLLSKLYFLKRRISKLRHP